MTLLPLHLVVNWPVFTILYIWLIWCINNGCEQASAAYRAMQLHLQRPSKIRISPSLSSPSISTPIKSIPGNSSLILLSSKVQSCAFNTPMPLSSIWYQLMGGDSAAGKVTEGLTVRSLSTHLQSQKLVNGDEPKPKKWRQAVCLLLKGAWWT